LSYCDEDVDGDHVDVDLGDLVSDVELEVDLGVVEQLDVVVWLGVVRSAWCSVDRYSSGSGLLTCGRSRDVAVLEEIAALYATGQLLVCIWTCQRLCWAAVFPISCSSLHIAVGAEAMGQIVDVDVLP
jgi:hypothetical protein